MRTPLQLAHEPPIEQLERVENPIKPEPEVEEPTAEFGMQTVRASRRR